MKLTPKVNLVLKETAAHSSSHKSREQVPKYSGELGPLRPQPLNAQSQLGGVIDYQWGSLQDTNYRTGIWIQCLSCPGAECRRIKDLVLLLHFVSC